MRRLIVFTALSLLGAFYSKGQIVEMNDTLFLNYFVNAGARGHDEGIMIFYKNNELHGKGIAYNNSSISFILNTHAEFDENNIINPLNLSAACLYLRVMQADSLRKNAIIDFYRKNRNNYTVLKPEWVLSKEQREFIAKVLYEIRSRHSDVFVFSGAGEHYAILSNKGNYVYIDRTGSWNIFLAIRQVLNISVPSLLPRLITPVSNIQTGIRITDIPVRKADMERHALRSFRRHLSSYNKEIDYSVFFIYHLKLKNRTKEVFNNESLLRELEFEFRRRERNLPRHEFIIYHYPFEAVASGSNYQIGYVFPNTSHELISEEILRFLVNDKDVFMFYIYFTSRNIRFAVKNNLIYVLTIEGDGLKIMPLEDFVECCWESLLLIN